MSPIIALVDKGGFKCYYPTTTLESNKVVFMHTRGFARLLAVFICTSVFMPMILSAQETQTPEETEQFVEPYGKGDQMFTMSGGLFIPLFIHFPYADELSDTETFESTGGHIFLGGLGSLGWSSFLTNRVFLGITLTGAFTQSVNENKEMILPLCLQAGYLFLAGSFEIPVSLEAGIAMNKYEDQTYFGPMLKPGASVYWVMNASWGFGLNFKYWWVPEIYFGSNSSSTSFGNFSEVSLSARYRF